MATIAAGVAGLCLASEEPTYGFAIAGLLSGDGSLGRVWQVSKPTSYGAMQRLERLGLVQMAGEQHTTLGPARSLVKATRTAARRPERGCTSPSRMPGASSRS